jgi:hypothetical protein
MDIKHFTEALNHKESVTEQHRQTCETLRNEAGAAILAAAKARFPRRRFGDDAQKALQAMGDDGGAIVGPFHARLLTEATAFADLTEGLIGKLQVLAMATDIPVHDASPPDLLVMVAVSRASSWSSQGFGANKYAKAHAEADADIARALGLVAEVRPVGEHKIGGSYPRTLIDYGTFANTTWTGWEVAVRKNAVPLRDWVSNCLKRHVNPRVYYPFLPHGYEEKVGLDFHGEDFSPARLLTTETA